jgi:hypothetical protein
MQRISKMLVLSACLALVLVAPGFADDSESTLTVASATTASASETAPLLSEPMLSAPTPGPDASTVAPQPTFTKADDQPWFVSEAPHESACGNCGVCDCNGDDDCWEVCHGTPGNCQIAIPLCACDLCRGICECF